MPKVIILVGASGSGKSTWVREHLSGLQEDAPTLVVSADHYFLDEDGVYRFVGSLLAEAHGACKRRFLLGLQKAVPLIFVDNTCTRRWERKEYVQEALNAGYEVWLKVFDVPAEVCAERNTHGVPLEACRKMIERIDVPVGFYQITEA